MLHCVQCQEGPSKSGASKAKLCLLLAYRMRSGNEELSGMTVSIRKRRFLKLSDSTKSINNIIL